MEQKKQFSRGEKVKYFSNRVKMLNADFSLSELSPLGRVIINKEIEYCLKRLLALEAPDNGESEQDWDDELTKQLKGRTGR